MAKWIERLSAPTPESLNDQQRIAVQEISAGPRGAVIGPFGPLLHSPGLMTPVQRTGEYLRWHSDMEDRLRELVILMVARHWNQEFEWRFHVPIALSCGLSAATVDALAHSRMPADLSAKGLTLWRLIDELLRTRTVTDDAFRAAQEVMPERELIEYIGTAGYYGLLAMVMTVANTEPPEGDGLPVLEA